MVVEVKVGVDVRVLCPRNQEDEVGRYCVDYPYNTDEVGGVFFLVSGHPWEDPLSFIDGFQPPAQRPLDASKRFWPPKNQNENHSRHVI